MTKYTTVFASLLRHISRSEFQSAISRYNADFRTRTLKCWDFFKTLLYAQITGCFSVREIETSMKVNRNRLYHTGLTQVKRSTFCDALEKRNNGLFLSVFHEVANKAQAIAFKTKKKFKSPFRIIDMTTIPLCLAKYNWAKYRKAKGAVKLHLSLDGDNFIPINAYLTDGTIHEKNRMGHLTDESGVIYAMDRGYVDYKSLYRIDLNDSVFVTRMKNNCAYKRVGSNFHKADSPIISDVLIVLTGPVTKNNYPKQLRKIKYKVPETGKIYEFLTNDFKCDAQEIAEIYKGRWEVELYFKWIKQHLKLKSFYGTSLNAVSSQIWVALILTILMWIARIIDGITWTANELLIMIRAAIFTKNSLEGLGTNIPQFKTSNDSLQLVFKGIIC